MLTLALADVGLTALISLFFLILGVLTLRRARLGKYGPDKVAAARARALVAFGASGLFIMLVVRDAIIG